MKTLLILILAGVTFFEVCEAVRTAQKWNSYHSKMIANKDIPCPPNQTIIQVVEHNPINDINIDSFMQVYGITEETVRIRNQRENTDQKLNTKKDILIEPKKIVPDTPRFRIKVSKNK